MLPPLRDLSSPRPLRGPGRDVPPPSVYKWRRFATHLSGCVQPCWVVLTASLLLPATLPHAEPLEPESPTLQSSTSLQDPGSAAAAGPVPTFLSGERIFGRPDLETVLEGDATLRRRDIVIRADRLEYYQPDDLARARGHVYINRAGNIYEGPLLELRLDAFEGFFIEPRYQFLGNGAHGEAQRVDFQDEKRAIIRNATYSTCRRQPGPDWLPDWILRAASIRIDTEEDVGQASGAVVSFKGVPVLAVPSISFSLSGKRKSGFLPTSIGLDNVNGLEVTAPYYWNIAANRDATLVPTVMTKRGVDLGAEFRYLEAGYAGQVRADLMPADRLRQRSRWGLALNHQGGLETGIAALAGLAAKVSLNRVSDDNYWRDFTRVTPTLTQRLLPNDANLSWESGNWSANLRTLKWQTLQDALAPITPPYDRLPQIAARYARSNLLGFDYSLDADLTRFQADSTLNAQPNARRTLAVAQLSRPWLWPAGFVTPRVQLHATNYQFDTRLSNGALSASRVLPTFSLDSGLVYERDASYLGRNFRQTLEPRAFYVSTPYRDQSLLPNYDSGANDFNFASIYSENAFVGNDRVADNNLLTFGVTTRLLDLDSGAEAARFAIAQRLRFKDQRVTLPGGTPIAERLSDVLLGASVNWSPRWSTDATVQFNPKTEQSVRSTIGGRYSPGDYRVISGAYRFQRGQSEQIDIGWQWPINDLWGDRGQDLGAGRGQGEGRWYSVGRVNYSMSERRVVDSVVGVEYDGGCWLGRAVLERLQTSTSSANQRIMLQLEFVGLSRLGASPLKTLKENVPRYQYLREQFAAPSRFSNYD